MRITNIRAEVVHASVYSNYVFVIAETDEGVLGFGDATLDGLEFEVVAAVNNLGSKLIGLVLGLMSAFLGIGGGPINLVVLFCFFSMETKTAAHNSLYIILLSQIASLLYTILCGRVPEVPLALLLCMVCCGILGGMVGRRINKRISSRTVDKLFLILLVIIMGVCVYNFFLLYKEHGGASLPAAPPQFFRPPHFAAGEKKYIPIISRRRRSFQCPRRTAGRDRRFGSCRSVCISQPFRASALR